MELIIAFLSILLSFTLLIGIWCIIDFVKYDYKPDYDDIMYVLMKVISVFWLFLVVTILIAKGLEKVFI